MRRVVAKPTERQKIPRRHSPTERSLGYLRRQGSVCAVVEKWNPWAQQRVDLFGFADIVALEPAKLGVLAIQATTGNHVGNRLQKILDKSPSPERGRKKPRVYARLWLECGNRLAIHGWCLKGKQGKRKVFQCRERFVTLEDF